MTYPCCEDQNHSLIYYWNFIPFIRTRLCSGCLTTKHWLSLLRMSGCYSGMVEPYLKKCSVHCFWATQLRSEMNWGSVRLGVRNVGSFRLCRADTGSVNTDPPAPETGYLNYGCCGQLSLQAYAGILQQAVVTTDYTYTLSLGAVHRVCS
jgi:hypothetical protein